jgi:hypothetical protein
VATFCAGLRAGDAAQQRTSSARGSDLRAGPLPSISLKLMKRTPSSSRLRENGGIEPGVMPPMSAWWPRDPT